MPPTPNSPIETGRKAPPFSLPDQTGETRTLALYRGKPFVLYFYPKDNTEDCTIEACAYRDLLPDFTKLEVPILGVSPDGPRTHTNFIAKHNLNFPLLSDPKPESPVCRAYGVFVEKTMYGKPATTIARTTFLIDADGVIRARWDKKEIEADVTAHPAAVRDAVKRLLAGKEPLPATTIPEAKPEPAKPAAKPTKKAASKAASRQR